MMPIAPPLMGDDAFDAKLADINQEYAKRHDGADAYRDRELARLFGECGWSQERIAKRMGKTQGWVSQRIIFAAFLSFITTGNKIDRLTERAFRGAYSRTRGKDQEDRFAQTLTILLDRESGDERRESVKIALPEVEIDFFDESKAIRAMLEKRRGTWPERFRGSFYELVRRVANSAEAEHAAGGDGDGRAGVCQDHAQQGGISISAATG